MAKKVIKLGFQDKLYSAVLCKSPDEWEEDLNKLDNVDFETVSHQTLLHTAVWAGRYEWVRMLLAKGADPTIKDERDMNVLEVAQLLSSIEENDANRRRIVDSIALAVDCDKADYACNTGKDEEDGKINTNFPEEFSEFEHVIGRFYSILHNIADEVRLLKSSLKCQKVKIPSLSLGVSSVSSNFTSNTKSERMVDQTTMVSKNSEGGSQKKITFYEGESLADKFSDLQSKSQVVEEKVFELELEVQKRREDRENLESLMEWKRSDDVANEVGHSFKVDGMDSDSFLESYYPPVGKTSKSILGIKKCDVVVSNSHEVSGEMPWEKKELEKTTEDSSPHDYLEGSLSKNGPSKEKVELPIGKMMNTCKQNSVQLLRAVVALENDLVLMNNYQPAGEMHSQSIQGSQKSMADEFEPCASKSDVLDCSSHEGSGELCESTEVSSTNDSFETSIDSPLKEKSESVIEQKSNAGKQKPIGQLGKIDTEESDSVVNSTCHLARGEYFPTIQGARNSMTNEFEDCASKSDVLDGSSQEASGELYESMEVSSPNDSFETSIDSPLKGKSEPPIEQMSNVGKPSPIGQSGKMDTAECDPVVNCTFHPAGREFFQPFLMINELEQRACQSDVVDISSCEATGDLHLEKNEPRSEEVSYPQDVSELSTGRDGCVENQPVSLKEQKNDDAGMNLPEELVRVFLSNLTRMSSFGNGKHDCTPIQSCQESPDDLKEDAQSFDDFKDGFEKFQLEKKMSVDESLKSGDESNFTELSKAGDCNLMQNLEVADGDPYFSSNEDSDEKCTEFTNKKLENGGIGTVSDESINDTGATEESIDSNLSDQCGSKHRPEFNFKKASKKQEPSSRQTIMDRFSQFIPLSLSMSKDGHETDVCEEVMSCVDQSTTTSIVESASEAQSGYENASVPEAHSRMDEGVKLGDEPSDCTVAKMTAMNSKSDNLDCSLQTFTQELSLKGKSDEVEKSPDLLPSQMQKSPQSNWKDVKHAEEATNIAKKEILSSDDILNHCINTMMKMTVIIDCNQRKSAFVRKFYGIMYSRCSLNSILMKFIIGQPNVKIQIDCESETIIRMKKSFKDHDGKCVNGSERRTFADFDEKVIYLGGLVNQEFKVQQIIGVLCSSLCLMSLYLAFNNRGRPYAEGDKVKREEFRKLIAEALTKKRCGGQLMTCIQWALGRENLIGKEIAVMAVLSQIIALYGMQEGTSKLRQQLPSLLLFFEDQVVETLSRECEGFWAVSDGSREGQCLQRALLDDYIKTLNEDCKLNLSLSMITIASQNNYVVEQVECNQ